MFTNALLTMLPGAADDPITGIAGKVIDKGLGTESIVLITIIVIPTLALFLFVVAWKFGGLKEWRSAGVAMEEAKRDAMIAVRDISEIHERILTKSNSEYRELLAKHREMLDRSPRLRSTVGADSQAG